MGFGSKTFCCNTFNTETNNSKYYRSCQNYDGGIVCLSINFQDFHREESRLYRYKSFCRFLLLRHPHMFPFVRLYDLSPYPYYQIKPLRSRLKKRDFREIQMTSKYKSHIQSHGDCYAYLIRCCYLNLDISHF